MRYGFCTGFAASMTGPISYPLIDAVAAAGYDYVEFPLMQTAALSDAAFDTLAAYLADAKLAADCTCNMFPASLRITEPKLDRQAVGGYLELAFGRLARLGTRTIVLGSTGARNLPAGTDEATGYERMMRLLTELVIPLLDAYDMTVAIEPINGNDSNFIRTLPEGMALVERAAHPRVQLLADLMHMLYEQESPEALAAYAANLRHIHVSERDRALPYSGYSGELAALLERLHALGYNGTISFECGPSTAAETAAALRLLRRTMEA